MERQRKRYAARQRAQRVRQVSEPQLVVPSEKLGPGLFDERHPERAGRRVARVQRPAVLIVRQPVVHRQRHPRLADEELESVHAVRTAANRDE